MVKFDSSFKRNNGRFPLNQVIPCWTEGVQLMKVGGKARLVCPANIAYGERGTNILELNTSFEVELLEIMVAQQASSNLCSQINVKPV